MLAMNMDDVRKNLKKFFRGEDSEEGRELIDRWYHYFDSRSDELNDISEEEKEKLRNEMLAEIRKSVSPPGRLMQPGHYGYHRRKHTRWPLKVAAGFVIVLLVSLSVAYVQGFIVPGAKEKTAIAYRTAVNPAGQTSHITLPDGSTVWLSAASLLRYPVRFTDNTREVTLTGEAFFEVVRNPDKPFIVNSEDLRTRVLGTSFNIRAFENEEDIQVTVATGQVSVEQTESGTSPVAMLSPNQQVIFDKERKIGVVRTVNTELFTGWKDDKLVFNNNSFEEIARRLERWYGVRIYFVDPSLKQTRFKITFEDNSLQHVLEMLQVTKNFEFKIKDNQVWINSSTGGI